MHGLIDTESEQRDVLVPSSLNRLYRMQRGNYLTNSQKIPATETKPNVKTKVLT